MNPVMCECECDARDNIILLAQLLQHVQLVTPHSNCHDNDYLMMVFCPYGRKVNISILTDVLLLLLLLCVTGLWFD
jgi:hypothetical protein